MKNTLKRTDLLWIHIHPDLQSWYDKTLWEIIKKGTKKEVTSLLLYLKKDSDNIVHKYWLTVEKEKSIILNNILEILE